MPNGVDKNFVRFISCISGFKERWDGWPTRIRLDPSFIRELGEVMSNADLQTMKDQIALITDRSNPLDSLFIAEDDDGHTYDLMKDGYGGGEADVLGWLGIEWPDYGPD